MRFCAWMLVCSFWGCGHLFVEEQDTSLDGGPDAPRDTRDGTDVGDDGVPGDGGRDAPADARDAPDAMDGGTDALDAGPDVPADVFDGGPDVFDGGSPLVGRGLLARFPMTMRVADVLVSTGAPFQLVPTGPNTSVTRVSTVTGDALTFSAVSSPDGYCNTVGTSPVSMLDGSNQGTIEVVAVVADADFSASRLLATGESGAWGFSLGHNQSGFIIFSMNQSSAMFGRWPAPPFGDRHVLTVVVDTTQPAMEDRLILYIDGVPQVNEGEGLARDLLIDVPSTNEVCVGNSQTRDRSIAGTIYYAAYYGRALTQAEVATNVALLLTNDDL